MRTIEYFGGYEREGASGSGSHGSNEEWTNISYALNS
jgi:hypothetical protein